MHLAVERFVRIVDATRLRTTATPFASLVIAVLSVTMLACGASTPTAPTAFPSSLGSLATTDSGSGSTVSAPVQPGSQPTPATATEPTTAESPTTPEATPPTPDAPAPLPAPDPVLLELVLNPASVVSGDKAVGTVRVSQGAPAAGVVITLRTNASAITTVPASVTVPSGATTAHFDIETQGPLIASALISATLNEVTRSAVLAITQPPTTNLDAVLAADSIVSGTQSQGTVRLTFPAGYFGLPIALSTSAPELIVPSEVVVPRGHTTVQFPISAGVVTGSAPFTVVIEARLGSVVRTHTLQFIPQP